MRFALVAAILLHAALAYALQMLATARVERPLPPMEVSIEVKQAPPPPPPPPPPEPAPAVVEPPRPAPRRKVAATAPRPTPPPPAPAAGPPDDRPPAPERVYVMDTGQLAVSPGPPEGKPTGRPGGAGQGSGGGGTAGGSGAKVVPLASVASMPEALGDYDLSRDYPEAARRQGVEGEAVVRLLVDEAGRVAQARLVRGPGSGLNEKAVDLGRRIRFKPARDDAGAAVATWITWTFNFTLPR